MQLVQQRQNLQLYRFNNFKNLKNYFYNFLDF